ncbi:hypothetical protein [Flavobacterium branchiicola]|uniref:Uncharacterized protein n=1 Tax=Flavobacterium branchiicola TaxID=1114875 RepID=A0ABV9PLI5_9FLAO|nr:hypothetical protein [Flavobacterium branchiicola]MBS7256725.1 hypothetical protein [Flavobacterium branchiicola]
MKKILSLSVLIILFTTKIAAAHTNKNALIYTTEYETSVTFPAGYSIGDYVEFLRVDPISAGASGYYQISISYTRGNVASAATHIASISHSNPALWRETGRVNNNPYTGVGTNFTIDCNTQSTNPRFRIRAINTLGINTPITAYIKVTSINQNGTFTALNSTGNDLTTTQFLPMTSDWDLYVGNVFTPNGTSLAIKAIQNGNVGIGTANPTSKLTVAGNIASREVKVSVDAGADFVFDKDYNLPSLESVDKFIKENKHLPEIASANEMKKDGMNLSEMNIKLLQKIEELTLYMIEQKKNSNTQENKIEKLYSQIELLKKENDTFKSLFNGLPHIEQK